ncbi:MAG: radical SAM protein [Candidatus Aminicenantaceae bacterium]
MRKTSRRRFLEESLAVTGSFMVYPYRPDPREAERMARTPSRSPYPSYLSLSEDGRLKQRADDLKEIYRNCSLCPRDCRVDRTQKQLGKCQATAKLRISSAFPHFGEERPLVGQKGSGTIFLSHCNLRCIYCQNYTISIEGEGVDIPDERAAAAMLKLQNFGCHNINWVTPTHYLPSLINALTLAVPMGLKIPIVYNTSGYEKLEVLEYLDGVVDIYLPDFKYWDSAMAGKFSSEAYNYPHYARLAFKEMFRQVGDLVVDGKGVAQRGLMVRHLVLPNRAAGTREVLRFIAEELSRTTYVNIMRQYRPEHRAREHKEIDRRLTGAEYAEALAWAREFGLANLDR